MKFNPSWQQVALIAVLFAAVISAHIWAPPAAAAVVSLVSVLIGYLAPAKKSDESEKQPAPVPTLVPKDKEDQ